jgi:RNA polymerase subunit RPABC4/transcription elongation factor Spt4
MPQRVICHGCSYVLYESAEFSPLCEIIQQCNGICPKCGRNLSFLPLDIEVKPVNK